MRISDWSSDVCSSDLDTLVAVLQLEEYAEIKIDILCAAAEEALLLLSLRPVQVEDDLAEGVASLFQADARARFFERDLLEAHRRRRCRCGRRGRCRCRRGGWRRGRCWRGRRSEEHTSELQSLMRISYAVFCLKTKKID